MFSLGLCLLAVSWLLFYAALGRLVRKISELEDQVTYWRQEVLELDETVNSAPHAHRGLRGDVKAQAKRLADVERLVASQESGLELNAAGLEAQTTLSILHAETVTRLQSRVDKLAHDPHYQRPVRRDN